MRILCLFGAAASLLSAACAEELPKTCADRGDGDDAVLLKVMDGGSRDAGSVCVDRYPASRVDATVDSPGRDESYARSQAGVLAWTSVTYDEAVEACGRAGKFMCSVEVARAITGATITGSIGFKSALEVIPPQPSASIADETQLILLTDGVGALELSDANGTLITFATTRKLVGSIAGDAVRDDGKVVPVADHAFMHPLVGFRCCTDVRVWNLFEALGHDERYVRQAPPAVPIAD